MLTHNYKYLHNILLKKEEKDINTNVNTNIKINRKKIKKKTLNMLVNYVPHKYISI